VLVNIRGKIDNSRHKFPGIGLLLIRCLISEKKSYMVTCFNGLARWSAFFDAGGYEFESWPGGTFWSNFWVGHCVFLQLLTFNNGTKFTRCAENRRLFGAGRSVLELAVF
jgi:hypothetical protein